MGTSSGQVYSGAVRPVRKGRGQVSLPERPKTLAPPATPPGSWSDQAHFVGQKRGKKGPKKGPFYLKSPLNRVFRGYPRIPNRGILAFLGFGVAKIQKTPIPPIWSNLDQFGHPKPRPFGRVWIKTKTFSASGLSQKR